jgi:hypothetical protein
MIVSPRWLLDDFVLDPAGFAFAVLTLVRRVGIACILEVY